MSLSPVATDTLGGTVWKFYRWNNRIYRIHKESGLVEHRGVCKDSWIQSKYTAAQVWKLGVEVSRADATQGGLL